MAATTCITTSRADSPTSAAFDRLTSRTRYGASNRCLMRTSAVPRTAAVRARTSRATVIAWSAGLDELLDVGHPPLGRVEPVTRRPADGDRDLPGVHRREELLADEEHERQRRREQGRHRAEDEQPVAQGDGEHTDVGAVRELD